MNLIILFLLYSCGKVSENNQSKAVEPEFSVDKSYYTIIEYNPKAKIFENAKTTDLSNSELIEIEKILKSAIEENNDFQANNLKKHNEKYPENQINETGFELELGDYRRQYIPVINVSGEKEVWINFMCDEANNEIWRTELLPPVEDGGKCYFNIKINLTTKSYSELRINGYA